MENATRVSFAAMLLAARQKQGLSQYQVAVRAGCSPPTVHYAEKGAGSPALFERLARVLGVKFPTANGARSQAAARGQGRRP